jgi:23S rRNA (guanosine2251-2'-O)-methyltransferase
MGKRKSLGQQASDGGGGGHPLRRSRGGIPDRRPRKPSSSASRDATAEDGRYWIYGHHAVAAALRNPRRRLSRLLLTAETEAQFAEDIAAARARLGDRLAITLAEREGFAERLGIEAVHQGLAVEALPLPPPDLGAMIDAAGPQATFLVLDQVTDPHNVGAILRSAAAFGAAGVIHTQHRSPPETGSLAKAASGGLEQVPLIRVVNLVQALETLKKAGFWCLGLAAEGAEPLAKADLDGRIAFVLGAEGAGLRRLTRQHCDLLVRLPTVPGLVQLNVSNAAAVALYERARAAKGEPEAG